MTIDNLSELERRNNEMRKMLKTLQECWAELEEKNKKLHYLATIDPLTNILNRRAFNKRFATEFKEALSAGQDLSCIMADIDHFKLVNVTFGQKAGDEVLKLFSGIVRSNLREQDLLGRYGGDEFCVVLPGIGLDEALSIAERIRRGVQDISEKEDSRDFQITASFGVASICGHAEDFGELNTQANRALCIAKDEGRNRVVRWQIERYEQLGHQDTKQPIVRPANEKSISVTADFRSGIAAIPNHPRHPDKAEVERLQSRIRQLEDIASKYSEELNYKSNYDSLTGLPNQLLFYDRIRQAIIRRRRYNQTVGILTLDITLFKRVNNALGREAGDLLLKQMAGRLSAVLRQSDVIALFEPKSDDIDLTVSRLTADEFGVLLTDLNSKQAVTWIVKRIFESLSKPIVIDGQKIFVNCSIGISLCPDDGANAEVLLNHSVAARQYAKQRSGQNNYQIYDKQMHEVSLTEMRIDTELRRAVENEEFVLYYQPRVNLKSSAFNGVEALIRWNHPFRGILSPYEFITVAEQSGLIVRIGEWVIRQACVQAKAWLAMGIHPVKIAVNLSTLQLRQDNFSDRILEMLRAADLSPSHIELEITETVIMGNLETAVDTLTCLHRHGFRISIDDFGTGYSSLNYLKHLPLDTLKIDRSFLQDILTDPYDKTIVKTIIAMAHSMSLSVTAEGVETGEQLDLLHKYSCDEVQGYLFSRPIPASETTMLLRKSPVVDYRSVLPTA